MAVLFFIERSRLARGTDRNEGIAALLDVKLDQFSKTQIIDCAVFRHWGHQSNDTTLNHANLSSNFSKNSGHYIKPAGKTQFVLSMATWMPPEKKSGKTLGKS